MNLAVIPARGGSQRIPRKNIREFFGKPIIAYSIQAAIDSGCFDEVMVSTDDDEIASVARSFGAKVPFMRSAEAASHTATTADVLLEVLDEYGKRGARWSRLSCIYATAAFVSPDILRQGMQMLAERPGIDAVVPIVRFSYPIQRALRLQDGYISLFQPEHLLSRSQDLESSYHDAGQFYCLDSRSFLASRKILGSRAVGLILPESRVQDLDNEDDWGMAELKYRLEQEKAKTP